MLQRLGFCFILMNIIIIILTLCVTEEKAGVILRNFKSRRMIMEELEEEEKAVRARLSLNPSNVTNVRTETLETANLIHQNNLKSIDQDSSNDDLEVEFKNISKSQFKKTLKTSKQKVPSSESVVNPQIKNNTSSRKPITLTKSFVEYLENRGRRMEDQVSSENEAWVSTNESSSPFRLISQINESLIVTNETSVVTSSEIEDIDESKELSEVEPENKVTSVQEMDNSTLKDSELDNKESEHSSMENITDILKEIKDTSNSELTKNSFPSKSLEYQEKNNLLEESDLNNLGNEVTEKQVNNSGLMMTFNDTISAILVEDQFKNLTMNTTNENSKKSLQDIGMNNQIKANETENNESSVTQIVSKSEEDTTVKPFEVPSDIIKETAKEFLEIIPEVNETFAVENIEAFVANLTDTVQNMSDEEVMDLEPEDEPISQSMPKEIPAINIVEKDNGSITMTEQISQSMPKEIPAINIVEKDNGSITMTEQISQSMQNKIPVIDTAEKFNASTIINDTANEFELSLESVVSSGLDFIVNSEVAKNAAIAMEVFNLSDSSLADHVIEDTDMHSFIDIIMPSTPIEETESLSKDQVSIGSNETITSSQSVEGIEVDQNKSEFDTNPKLNVSLVQNNITNTILESALALDANPNATSATERKCPTPGICVFWFMARDTCSDHTECLGEKMCCRVRCSKSCIDI